MRLNRTLHAIVSAALVGALPLAGSTLSARAKRGAGSAVTAEAIIAADGANWLSHGRTYDEQRFSPLDRINTGNVGQLGLAWYADMDTARGQEATPLVMDGKLNVTTAGSKVFAYDDETGEAPWS